MTWMTHSRTALAAATLALTLAACADDRQPSDLAGPRAAESPRAAATVYDQVDFLGNPLVSEVTIVKANHDQYNRSMPYASATFRPQTEQFVTSFGRPQSLASTLGSVLYPDILIVDPSKSPSTAGWLSWALASGWGGRKLTDDVVDLGLTAIFSSFLEPAGALCQPFQLPLCTDNVGANDKAFRTSFPYLANPS